MRIVSSSTSTEMRYEKEKGMGALMSVMSATYINFVMVDIRVA